MKAGFATGRAAGRLWRCGMAVLAALCSAAASEDLPSGNGATNAAVRASAALRRAAEAEREGHAEAAVAAYEALLTSDTSLEAAVAPRLVALHADLGRPAQALAWALRVARRHPDPAAYLAGVHAQLSQFKEAELMLREALREASDAGRRVTLLWQLAEAQENLGERDDARASLTQARDLLPDGPRRATADRRLDALRDRIKAAERQRGDTDSDPAPTQETP